MRTILVAICALATFAAPALAQPDTFPSRQITILVPFPPGGTSDVVTRAIAQKVADATKANIVIDNRSGGGGTVAAIATKQAPPDGTTLFLANNGLFAVTPAIMADVRFDPVKDFQPVTPLVLFPSVLIVPAAAPVHNLKELVAYGKSKPNGLSYASQGIGSGGHIMGELFRQKTGLPMVHVPYRGAGPAAQDVAGGSIDMLFTSYISAAGQIQGGKVRVIAFTGQKRSPVLPDVPTTAEQGFAGIELDIWHGIVAPPGTPMATVRRLNEEFVKAAHTPEVEKMIAAQAADILTASPEEFAKLIGADIDRLGKAVRAAGIKIQ